MSSVQNRVLSASELQTFGEELDALLALAGKGINELLAAQQAALSA